MTETTADFELVTRLARATQLVGIRLNRLNASVGTGNEGRGFVEIRVSPSYTLEEDLLIYEFDFDVRVKRGRKNAFKARLVYEVAFALMREPDGDDFSTPEVQAFGDMTALRIIHPYVRQKLHTLSLDFEVSPVVIDLLRVHLSDPATHG